MLLYVIPLGAKLHNQNNLDYVILKVLLALVLAGDAVGLQHPLVE